MRLSTKIILWAWLILILTVGSLIYSAYSKLNPDSLVSLLNGQIETNYPGSKLEIGKVQYGFSLDFDLTLRNLILKRSDKLMAQAGEIQLKVPWWLILLDRGSAQVILNDLTIFVQAPDEDLTNPIEKSIDQKAKLNTIRLNLPKYLKDAIYTLRGRNITIKEQNGERRFFTLSKLLVKDFQYGKNSAFEINIPISISHRQKHFSSDLWLFGDLTPGIELWNFNYRGEFRTKDSAEGLHLDDLVLQGVSRFNPLEVDLASELELKVNQKTVGSGSVLARNDKMTFDLSFKSFPLSYLNLIGDEIKNPYLNLKSGRADGKLKYVRSLKNDGHTLISSKLIFPGDFHLSDVEKLKGQWTLSIENDKWETNFISPKGEISFFRRAVIDFEKGQIRQSTQELGFSEFDFGVGISIVQNFDEFLHNHSKYFSSSLLSFKKCKIKEKLIEATFKHSASPFENFYQAQLETEKTKLLFNFLSKNGLNQLSLEAKDFEWLSSYRFLLPYLNLDQGIINGNLTGNWQTDWFEGKWESSISFSNYKNIAGSFIDPLKKVFSDLALDVENSNNIILKFKLDKKMMKFSSSSISGNETKIFDGDLAFEKNQKSYLIIRDPKNKKSKNIRTEILNPFLVEGAP